jgi:hypothetical protein
MTNKFFPKEHVTEDDLYFVCYMIERVARKLGQPNRYVVNALGYDELYRQLSLASVLHSDNPAKVENDWIEENHLKTGSYHVTAVRSDLNVQVPTPTQMGKVYKRLILSTLREGEDWINALIRVYSNPICETLDNYNCSAYYEPSPIITRAYLNGGF